MSCVYFDLFLGCICFILLSLVRSLASSLAWTHTIIGESKTILCMPYVISQSVRIFIFRSFYRRHFAFSFHFFLPFHFIFLFFLYLVVASLLCVMHTIWDVMMIFRKTKWISLYFVFFFFFFCSCTPWRMNSIYLLFDEILYQYLSHKMYDMHNIKVSIADGTRHYITFCECIIVNWTNRLMRYCGTSKTGCDNKKMNMNIHE